MVGMTRWEEDELAERLRSLKARHGVVRPELSIAEPKKWLVDTGDAESIFTQEGWGLFLAEKRYFLICRIDELGVFADDTEAQHFVEARAKEGSALHSEAVRLHGTTAVPQ